MMKEPYALDVNAKQSVRYCIPLWLRDEQVKLAIQKVPGRIEPHPVRPDPIAIVGYGPSLKDTWEKIKNFKYVMSCSGSHKFLIERGIIPTWHIEVDPREHKVELLGTPHPNVIYLPSSSCHPKYFDHLIAHNAIVRLWHVFAHDTEAVRILPPGEWAITGGCDVGLRCLTIARFFGFTEQHIFGIDGSAVDGKRRHAGEHPNAFFPKSYVEIDNRKFFTSPGMLEAARTVFHELDQMPDIKPIFYGDGLVQAMAKTYNQKPATTSLIAFHKPELITPEFCELNRRLHRDKLEYGVGGGKYANTVLKLVESLLKTSKKQVSVLDYGCGKGYLAKALPFPIAEYDPAIPGKESSPRPADIVICTDVLEHIEPEKLMLVLYDIHRCTLQVGYLVIHMGPASKTYADGRNTHLIQQSRRWWEKHIGKIFQVGQVFENGPELHIVVGPKKVTPKNISSSTRFIFETIELITDPYPAGIITPVMDNELYQKLVAAWPDESLFKHMTGHYLKYSLSERNNPEAYQKIITGAPWDEFHRYVKGPMIDDVLIAMRRHGMELPGGKLTARFEFSSLPASKGGIDPHTDIPSKLITLVIPMLGPSDIWDSAWGGGTDLLRPTDPDANLVDYEAPRSEFTIIRTAEFVPNQCLLFIRSPNSWHSVGPIQGPFGTWRRSLTINIEKT